MVMRLRMLVHQGVVFFWWPALRTGVPSEEHALDRGIELPPPDSASFDNIWPRTGSCHRLVLQSMSL